MASYCSQLGIKIKTWFRKIGSRWWYKRRRNSGRKENDSQVWSEYFVPLESVAGRVKNFSLETQYCKSHSTGFLGDNDLETRGCESRETIDSGQNKIAGPRIFYLCGQSSSKTSALAVSSCPSRIQTGDWFFPKTIRDVNQVETAEWPEISVVPAVDHDTTVDGKSEWMWFPGDNEFREKTPENNRWDTLSFRDPAACSICQCGYPFNYPDHTSGVGQATAPNRIWNENNLNDFLSNPSNLHSTLGQDPAELEAAERMLKEIIFDSQERAPASSSRICTTYPIAIESGKAGVAHCFTQSDNLHICSDQKMRKTERVFDSMWKMNWPANYGTTEYHSRLHLETSASPSSIPEKKKLQPDKSWCQIFA